MNHRRPHFVKSTTPGIVIASCLLSLALVTRVRAADDAKDAPNSQPLLEAELIFQPIHLHTHGSCVVECPNGDLLACWYQGSGERRADDVAVYGARRRQGEKQWSQPFVMADTPGFPDTNPCLLVDPRGKLWLIWQTIIANEWHTALTKYRISSSYEGDGAPRWDTSDTLILKPGPEFAETVARQCDADEKTLDRLPEPQRDRARAYLARRRERAADKYFIRMGWMTRAHPLVLDGKQLIVPLYSDGFDFSIMALSDDWGTTWSASLPLVSHGGVQPSLARKKGGTLVALMRDNGPPPKRVLRSESTDGGKTWSPVVDTEIPNSGAGLEVISLASGNWLLINNDTEQGRHRLTVSLSDDEGSTWKWSRPLEFDEPGPEATTAAYPSIIQSRDSLLHATYTYTLKGKNARPGAGGKPQSECIKHAVFNEAFIRAGAK
ncbi:MAG: exo-alpha-sialidase [Planctomycetia bacterium]|nr:exo-alpha-sialidase [Planctomycetia bacterium]